VESFDWQCLNFYDGCVRWCVPVFVMISGALFLRADIKIKKLYSKNILRIVTAFLFWSFLYALASYHFKGKDIEDCVTEFVQGHYHMWFLFMIVGLYIISPLLRPIVKSENIMEYFLFLSFLFTMVLPSLAFCLSYLDSDKVELYSSLLDRANIHMILGYCSYFVLGYYLHRKELSKRWRIVIYLLGILGFVTTVGLTYLYTQNEGQAQDYFYSFFSVNVAMEAMGVFVFFKYHVGRKRYWFAKFITVLSVCSFGAYLVHTMIIERMYELVGINAVSFNPAVSVLVIGSIVFVISFVIAFLLKNIPFVRDYIV